MIEATSSLSTMSSPDGTTNTFTFESGALISISSPQRSASASFSASILIPNCSISLSAIPLTGQSCHSAV